MLRFRIAGLLAFGIAAAAAGEARAADGFQADRAGRLRMLRSGAEFLDVTSDLCVAAKGWKKSFRLNDAKDVRSSGDAARRRFTGVLPAGDANSVAFEQTIRQDGNSVRLTVKAVARDEMDIAGVYLFLHWPVKGFAGGRIVLDSTDPNAKLTATTLPATLPAEHHFLEAQADGLTAAGPAGRARLAVKLDRPRDLTIQDGRKWNDDHYDAYFPFLKGKLAKGQSSEVTVTLKLTTAPDREPAELKLDAARKGYRLEGFGGNFVFGIDSPVTRHNLATIQLAWARVGMNLLEWEPTNDNGSPEEIDWAYFERRDRKGSELRAEFEVARQLARRGVPFISSIWRVPDFMTADPSRGPQAHQRRIPEAKWPELLESIGAYLLHAKRKYGAEPVLLSFNEADIGCYVLLSAEEHREQIRRMGAHLERLGLKTKLLLGDVARRENVQYVAPTLADPEAMKHVGALSFHTWGQRAEHFTVWRDLARRVKLPLLAAEVGPDAAAWKDHSFNTLHYYLKELRMYQELLLHAEPQVLLEWEYTGDYRMLEPSRGTDGKETVQPTPRYWMIRQFANFTPRPAVALHAESGHPNVLFTAFADADSGRRLALHVANPAAARTATINGIPAGIAELAAVRTTWRAGSELLPPVEVRDGRAELRLEDFSLLTLTAEMPRP